MKQSFRTAVLFTLSIFHFQFSISQITRFERSNGEETVTYEEGMKWWKQFDLAHDEVGIKTMGQTDAGLSLHLIILSKDKDFDLVNLRKKNKKFLLINNDIHPGESDGVDASMLFAR